MTRPRADITKTERMIKKISRAKTISFSLNIPVSAIVKCVGDTVIIADTQAIIASFFKRF